MIMILTILMMTFAFFSLNKMMAACSDIRINKEMNSIEVTHIKSDTLITIFTL